MFRRNGARSFSGPSRSSCGWLFFRCHLAMMSGATSGRAKSSCTDSIRTCLIRKLRCSSRCATQVGKKSTIPSGRRSIPPAAELAFALLSRISATPWFYKGGIRRGGSLHSFFPAAVEHRPGPLPADGMVCVESRADSRIRGNGAFRQSPVAGDDRLDLGPAPRGSDGRTGAFVDVVGDQRGVSRAGDCAKRRFLFFLLPAWLFALKRRSIVLSISIAIPVFLSFMYGGLGVVTKSLREFAYVSRFNDLVWWLVEKSVWANPAPEKCALLHRAARGCLRARGDLSQGLAAERALGAGRGVDSQSGAASVVCHLDSSAGLLAQTAGVVRALVERFRLRSAGGKRLAAFPLDRLDDGSRAAFARVDLPMQTEAGRA